MKTFHITVKRTEWREADFTIQADNRKEAVAKARDAAANHDYNNANNSAADYEVVDVRQGEG